MERDYGWPAMVCFGLAMIAMFALPICAVGSALHWLRNGYGWTMTMAGLLDYLGRAYPMQNWVGLQQMIDWYMGQAAWWAAPLGLSAFFYVMAYVCETIRHDNAQEAKRIKDKRSEREAKKAAKP